MHLYRSNCIFDIPNCKSYSEGFDCASCEKGYEFNIVNSSCDLIPPPPDPTPQQDYTDKILHL